jgi:hypothetical protein
MRGDEGLRRGALVSATFLGWSKYMVITSDVFNRPLNEREAAQILGLNVKTLRRWRWAGKGPRFLKMGSAVRYERADLEAYKAAARRTSTSDTGAAPSTKEAA